MDVLWNEVDSATKGLIRQWDTCRAWKQTEKVQHIKMNLVIHKTFAVYHHHSRTHPNIHTHIDTKHTSVITPTSHHPHCSTSVSFCPTFTNSVCFSVTRSLSLTDTSRALSEGTALSLFSLKVSCSLFLLVCSFSCWVMCSLHLVCMCSDSWECQSPPPPTLWVCGGVCVKERESRRKREQEWARERDRQTDRERAKEREGGREREREGERERERAFPSVSLSVCLTSMLAT